MICNVEVRVCRDTGNLIALDNDTTATFCGGEHVMCYLHSGEKRMTAREWIDKHTDPAPPEETADMVDRLNEVRGLVFYWRGE